MSEPRAGSLTTRELGEGKGQTPTLGPHPPARPPGRPSARPSGAALVSHAGSSTGRPLSDLIQKWGPSPAEWLPLQVPLGPPAPGQSFSQEEISRLGGPEHSSPRGPVPAQTRSAGWSRPSHLPISDGRPRTPRLLLSPWQAGVGATHTAGTSPHAGTQASPPHPIPLQLSS